MSANQSGQEGSSPNSGGRSGSHEVDNSNHHLEGREDHENQEEEGETLFVVESPSREQDADAVAGPSQQTDAAPAAAPAPAPEPSIPSVPSMPSILLDAHREFSKVSTRNAKCDQCERRNISVMQKCRRCGMATCSRCYLSGSFDSRHDLTGLDLDWTPEPRGRGATYNNTGPNRGPGTTPTGTAGRISRMDSQPGRHEGLTREPAPSAAESDAGAVGHSGTQNENRDESRPVAAAQATRARARPNRRVPGQRTPLPTGRSLPALRTGPGSTARRARASTAAAGGAEQQEGRPDATQPTASNYRATSRPAADQGQHQAAQTSAPTAPEGPTEDEQRRRRIIQRQQNLDSARQVRRKNAPEILQAYQAQVAREALTQSGASEDGEVALPPPPGPAAPASPGDQQQQQGERSSGSGQTATAATVAAGSQSRQSGQERELAFLTQLERDWNDSPALRETRERSGALAALDELEAAARLEADRQGIRQESFWSIWMNGMRAAFQGEWQ